MSSRTARVKKSPANRTIEGHIVYNRILLALPAPERALLFPKLKFVRLPIQTRLCEVGKPIKSCVFVNDGLASFLSVLEDGKSVEAGLCGKEGFVGLPLAAGFKSSSARVIMQVRGGGFQTKSSDFLGLLSKCPKLLVALQGFTNELAMQSAQVAACNRLHEVDERLARWLLMSQDRLGGDLVPLTQEFLAHMLGTRRASVTVAAGILQRAGLISYHRGAIKVENRRQLEQASCECYGAMVRQVDRWHAEAESAK